MEEYINFDTLGLKISEYTKTYSMENQRQIYEYLSGLNETQRKGYEIAYDHLGSSFSVIRSNGFKDWLNSKNKK